MQKILLWFIDLLSCCIHGLTIGFMVVVSAAVSCKGFLLPDQAELPPISKHFGSKFRCASLRLSPYSLAVAFLWSCEFFRYNFSCRTIVVGYEYLKNRIVPQLCVGQVWLMLPRTFCGQEPCGIPPPKPKHNTKLSSTFEAFKSTNARMDFTAGQGLCLFRLFPNN